eukprot:TRINITY_DN6932_c0_g1_i1.p1 TRINITY_DN6932_c0_g1~~TRINITY_DN6932_c0_g1_i1.p1  ORF type:complete len:135 (-),score=9.31 TRINITY_DN6932_c0_g1_i1:172-576(-)
MALIMQATSERERLMEREFMFLEMVAIIKEILRIPNFMVWEECITKKQMLLMMENGVMVFPQAEALKNLMMANIRVNLKMERKMAMEFINGKMVDVMKDSFQMDAWKGKVLFMKKDQLFMQVISLKVRNKEMEQ